MRSPQVVGERQPTFVGAFGFAVEQVSADRRGRMRGRGMSCDRLPWVSWLGRDTDGSEAVDDRRDKDEQAGSRE